MSTESSPALCGAVDDCPTPLADNPTIVTFAYFSAFLPWTMLTLLDFIGPRWKTVLVTERNGWVHALLSVPPMFYVGYYVHLQRQSGDYKEMSAGIVALLFSFFHVARTLWGLLQLHYFKRWARHALLCLYRLQNGLKPGDHTPEIIAPRETGLTRLVAWVHLALGHACWAMRRLSYRIIRKEADLEKTHNSVEDVVHSALQRMLVNDTLIDNEFFGEELPCYIPLVRNLHAFLRFKPRVAWVQPVHPQACVIRWAVAVLSQYGGPWLQDMKNIRESTEKEGESERQSDDKDDDMRKWKRKRDFFATQLYTMAVMHLTFDSKAGQRSIIPLRVIPDDVHYLDLLGKQTWSHGYSLPYGAPASYGLSRYGAMIRDAVSSVDSSIRDSLTKEQSDALDEIQYKDLESFVLHTSMEVPPSYYHVPASLRDEPEEGQDGKKQRSFLDCKSIEWHLIKHQLGFSELEPVPDLLATYGTNTVPGPLPVHPARVGHVTMQTCFHIDNWIALRAGDRTREYLARPPASGMCPLQDNVRTRAADLEVRSLRYELARPDCDNIYHSFEFMGFVTEHVRSILAERVYLRSMDNRPESPTPVEVCLSKIAQERFSFDLSAQLHEALFSLGRDNQTMQKHLARVSKLQMRVLWECQRSLWNSICAHLTKLDSSDAGYLFQDIRLVMLMLLGFPALTVCITDEDRKSRIGTTCHDRSCCTIRLESESLDLSEKKAGNCNIPSKSAVVLIKPVGAPQPFQVQLDLHRRRLRSSLRVVGFQGCNVEAGFVWQDWRDAFVGMFGSSRAWKESHMMLPRSSFRNVYGTCDIDASWAKSVYDPTQSDDMSSKRFFPIDVGNRVRNGCFISYELFTTWLGWPSFNASLGIFEVSMCLLWSGTRGCNAQNRVDTDPRLTEGSYDEAGPEHQVYNVARSWSWDNFQLRDIFQIVPQSSSTYVLEVLAFISSRLREAELHMFNSAVTSSASPIASLQSRPRSSLPKINRPDSPALTPTRRNKTRQETMRSLLQNSVSVYHSEDDRSNCLEHIDRIVHDRRREDWITMAQLLLPSENFGMPFPPCRSEAHLFCKSLSTKHGRIGSLIMLGAASTHCDPDSLPTRSFPLDLFETAWMRSTDTSCSSALISIAHNYMRPHLAALGYEWMRPMYLDLLCSDVASRSAVLEHLEQHPFGVDEEIVSQILNRTLTDLAIWAGRRDTLDDAKDEFVGMSRVVRGLLMIQSVGQRIDRYDTIIPQLIKAVVDADDNDATLTRLVVELLPETFWTTENIKLLRRTILELETSGSHAACPLTLKDTYRIYSSRSVAPAGEASSEKPGSSVPHSLVTGEDPDTRAGITRE